MLWVLCTLVAVAALAYILRRPKRTHEAAFAEWLAIIGAAIASKRPVRMVYFAKTTGETTERVVQPLQLRSDGTAFLAFCQLRQELRTFLLEGIRSLQWAPSPEADQSPAVHSPERRPVQAAPREPAPAQSLAVRDAGSSVALAVPPPVPSWEAPSDPPESTALAVSAKRNSVVTTEEELRLFEIVSQLCTACPRARALGYKDTVAYFGVNIGGKPHSWFIRAFFNGPRKHITTKLPAWLAAALARDCQVDLPPKNLGSSRIYLADVEEVAQLQALVAAAFEYEVQQAEESPALLAAGLQSS